MDDTQVPYQRAGQRRDLNRTPATPGLRVRAASLIIWPMQRLLPLSRGQEQWHVTVFAAGLAALALLLLFGLALRGPLGSVDFIAVRASGTDNVLGRSLAAMNATLLVLALAIAAYLACAWALRRGFRHSYLAAVAGTALAALSILPVAPLSSPDAVHVAADVRTLWLHGRYPADRANAPGRVDDPVAKQVYAYPNAASGYGPLSYVIGGLPLPFTGDGLRANVFGQKVVAALALVALAALTGQLAKRVGADPGLGAGLVGLHPLLLWEFAGGGHNDLLMVAFGVLAVLLALGTTLRQRGLAVAAGAASVLSKFTLMVAAPLVLLYWWPRGRRLLLSLVVLAAIALVVLFNAHLVGPARGPATNVSPYTFWGVVQDWMGGGRWIVGFCYTLFAIFVLMIMVEHPLSKPRDLVGAIGLLLWLFVFACMPGYHPWYQAWFLPFALLSERRWLVTGALVFSLGAFLPILAINWAQQLSDAGFSDPPTAAALLLWGATALAAVGTWWWTWPGRQAEATGTPRRGPQAAARAARRRAARS